MSFIQPRPIATHDFYGPIHKGLRLAQTQLLVRLGACGGDDAVELTQLLGDLVSFCHVAEHHLENEDRWVHSALETRAPGRPCAWARATPTTASRSRRSRR